MWVRSDQRQLLSVYTFCLKSKQVWDKREHSGRDRLHTASSPRVRRNKNLRVGVDSLVLSCKADGVQPVRYNLHTPQRKQAIKRGRTGKCALIVLRFVHRRFQRCIYYEDSQSNKFTCRQGGGGGKTKPATQLRSRIRNTPTQKI